MEVDDFSEMVTSKTERVLHDHQKEFVRFFMDCVKAGHGCILADEMGLGKTLQSICAALYLYDRVGSFKCLICCPVSVLATWQDELGRFFDAGLKFKIYRGEGQERQKLQRTLMADSDDWNILLSTYEVCLNDKEFMAQTKWTCCIADEAHRLKNSSTQTFVAFSELPVKYWILLTGTPVQNNLNELYSFLRLIRPSEFTESGERKFVSRYKDIKNKAVMAELKSKLGAIMLRRTKMEVGLSIPTSSEVTLYHNITEMQKGLYKSILLRDRGNFSGLTKASFLSTLVQIRKCVCHPYLFEGVEPEPFKEGEHIVEASGKLSALDVLLNYLKRNGHRVLLFSQFVRVLDVVQDYLTYRGYTYERLDGSVRAEERFAAIDRFSAEKADTFVFLLSTRAGGLGLNLTAADTVIFYDSDWNPQNDLQAAARAHRIGQSKHVRIIRLVGRSTVEELILTKCGDKLRLADAVMKTEAAAKEESKNKWIQFLTYGLSDLMSSGDTDTEV